jgi:VWFA-related protein
MRGCETKMAVTQKSSGSWRAVARRIFAALAVTAALAAVCAGALAQEQQSKPATAQTASSQASSTNPAPPAAQSQGPPIKVNANLVTVYATVKDKHGKIIPNLGKDEFTLSEDGRPQTITYFVADTDVALTLGLLVDTSMSQRNVLGQERDASEKFLNDMLRPDRDKAFVIHFDREVELLQDLTASREKLEKALSEIEAPEFSNTRGGGSTSGDPDDADPPQRHSHMGGGTLLYDSVYLASNELMKKQQGRKAVIVLSDGVDRGSKVSLEAAVDAAQHADTAVYSILFADQEQGEYHHGGWGHVGMGGGMGGPGGQWPGGGGGYPREERPDGKKVLERLSNATGGEMFQVSKKMSVDDIYAKIAEQLRNQYSLGYVPDRAEPGAGFHKIALTTKNKDLVVQAREGYYSDK